MGVYISWHHSRIYMEALRDETSTGFDILNDSFVRSAFYLTVGNFDMSVNDDPYGADVGTIKKQNIYLWHRSSRSLSVDLSTEWQLEACRWHLSRM